jgi:hypothetical protein
LGGHVGVVGWAVVLLVVVLGALVALGMGLIVLRRITLSCMFVVSLAVIKPLRKHAKLTS